MNTLTGRIRHRILTVNWTRSTSNYLVLQVEEVDSDGKPIWRDARVEDLTVITLKSLTEIKQQ